MRYAHRSPPASQRPKEISTGTHTPLPGNSASSPDIELKITLSQHHFRADKTLIDWSNIHADNFNHSGGGH
jgi:hypothetical protein